jgi:hypothetical protein
MASDGSPPSKKRNFSKGNVWFIDDSSEESGNLVGVHRKTSLDGFLDPEQYAQAIHYDYTAAITSSSEDDWDSDEEEEQEAGDGEGSPEENKENKVGIFTGIAW